MVSNLISYAESFITEQRISKLLEPEQIKQYERDGFLFPLPIFSSNECLQFLAAFEEMETFLGGKAQRLDLVQTHLYFRWLYDLAVHPTILDTVEDIIGSNILVHSSSIFCKYPGDRKYVSWHQDGYYLQLNPPQLVSVWIALSDSTIENGCMQVLSGTHQQNLTHTEVKHKDNLLITGMKVAVEVDKAKAVDIILKPGEISLHHVNLIHGSQPNQSDTKRIGFAVRYITPQVKQTLPQNYPLVLARGQDNYHNYELLENLPNSNLEEGITAQKKLTNKILQRRKIEVISEELS